MLVPSRLARFKAVHRQQDRFLMALNDSALRALKPGEKRYVRSDGDGLAIEIYPRRWHGVALPLPVEWKN